MAKVHPYLVDLGKRNGIFMCKKDLSYFSPVLIKVYLQVAAYFSQ